MSIAHKAVCVCDGCGIERQKDTNHWWLVCNWHMPRGIVLRPWNDKDSQDDTTKHLCGLTCLYQMVDRLAQEILRQEVKAQGGSELWQANS